MKRRTNTKLVGISTRGWAIYVGETLMLRGRRVVVLGREGNLLIVRPFVPPNRVPVSRVLPLVEHQKVHPSEVGVRSSVVLPSYVTASS
jgi:hypothetical protein